MRRSCRQACIFHLCRNIIQHHLSEIILYWTEPYIRLNTNQLLRRWNIWDSGMAGFRIWIVIRITYLTSAGKIRLKSNMIPIWIYHVKSLNLNFHKNPFKFKVVGRYLTFDTIKTEIFSIVTLIKYVIQHKNLFSWLLLRTPCW